MKASIIQLTVTFPEKVFLAYALKEMEYKGLSDGILDLTRRSLTGQVLEHLSFAHLPFDSINSYDGHTCLISMRIEKEELKVFKAILGEKRRLATFMKYLLRRVLSYTVDDKGKVIALSSNIEIKDEGAGATLAIEIPPTAEKEEGQ